MRARAVTRLASAAARARWACSTSALACADPRRLTKILGFHLRNVEAGQHLPFVHAVVHIHQHLGDIAGDPRENRRPLDGLHLAGFLDRDGQRLSHRPSHGHGRQRGRRGDLGRRGAERAWPQPAASSGRQPARVVRPAAESQRRRSSRPQDQVRSSMDLSFP